MPTSSTDILITSEDQSIWASGDRSAITWSEYFPIIGGDRTTYELSNARVVQGGGRVTIDGESIDWEPPAWYANIANGVRRAVTIEIDMTDDAGTTTTRTLDITAIGTAAGTAYELPGIEDGLFGPFEFLHTSGSSEGGTEDKGLTDITVAALPATGIFQIDVVTARDILQDAHQFETMVPVNIDWDLMADIHELAYAATAGLREAEASAQEDAAAARAAWETAEHNAGLVNAAVTAGVASDAAWVARQAAQGTYLAASSLQSAWQNAQVEETAARGLQSAASATFSAASSALSAAQSALNGAKNTLASATSAASNFLGGIAFGSLQAIIDANNACDICVPDALVNSARSLQSDITSAQNSVNSWTSAVTSRTISFNNAQTALTQANADVNAAIATAANALNDLNDYLGDQTVGGLYNLFNAARNAYESALDEETATLQAMWNAGILVNQEPTAGDVVTYNGIAAGALAEKVYYDDIVETAVSLASDAADVLAGALTSTDVQIQARVEADVDAQVGLQVQMELDAGSVDSALDYRVETLSELDAITDTFTVQAVATNTNGDMMAFDTVSPNATFYAGIAYDIGAEFRVLLDLYSKIAGLEIIDFPNGANPLELTETLRMAGWIDLIDLDTRDLTYSVDLPGWVGDILGLNFAFPTVTTVGRAAPVVADVYTDPGNFDLARLADALLNFADARMDYSPEFRALLIQNGAYSDLTTNDFGEAFGTALNVFFDLLTGEGDTDGDGVVPLFLLRNDAGTVDGLFHIDTIADVISEVDINNVGSLGFFVAEGSSDNVVEVTVDLDQLVAVLINQAFGIPPNAAINPMDIGFGISDLLDRSNITPEAKAAIADFVTLDLGFEAMDLDVSAGVDFSQKFALSVDDMVFDLTFEDGTTRQVRASEGGEIVIQNASALEDTNGNGEIDYTLKLTPDATFFNDTQVGLNIGYTLDFLKAHFNAAASLPLDKIFAGLSLPGVSPSVGIDLSLGPVVRMQGQMNLLSADIFEDIFAFDAGSGSFGGAFAPATEPTTGVNYAGTDGHDDATGTKFADTMMGGMGNDTLRGMGNGDHLDGGLGADTILGNAGNDLLEDSGAYRAGGQSDDLLDGGKGNDTLMANWGFDTFIGNDGVDLLNIADSTVGFLRFEIDLAAGTDQYGNMYQTIENVLGSTTGDFIRGDAARNHIDGHDGNDVLRGGLGNDTLEGGNGTDDLNGEGGHDMVSGGALSDTIRGGNGHDTLDGGYGADSVLGGNGNDKALGGGGADDISGGNGKDLLFGQDGNDSVYGGSGADKIYGGANNDYVDGGFGNDTVFGSAGQDTLLGGGGHDKLIGGTDADVFVFDRALSGDDTIRDYVEGEDGLVIDSGLWGGAQTQAYLDSISDTSSGDLVLDFGAGGSITFAGVTTNAGLLDDIALIA